jgi:beta-aspartyl-dipeptidase (metallo-type)
MFILLERGDLFDPAPRGASSILIAGNRIAQIGEINRQALFELGLPVDVIDAGGCAVCPGLIDPHEHLIGGSGERGGFATQTPEIAASELIEAGITTVVGCLGTDNVTKSLPALLAKVKGLNEEGLTAFLWSGGYDVPPATLTGSLRNDLLFITEVIGAGEIAIADHRSSAPTLEELARLVKQAHVGGMLAGKAGVTHFHVGDEPRRLADIRLLLDEYSTRPEWLYPTHVERNEPLRREAVELTNLGVAVDIDTVERDLPQWLRYFAANGGNWSRLTISSDAAINSPSTVLQQLRDCVLNHGFALESVLPLTTSNPAQVLNLWRKGRLEVGADADLVVLRSDSLELIEVIANGKRLLKDGKLAFAEAFLNGSNRHAQWAGSAYSPHGKPE